MALNLFGFKIARNNKVAELPAIVPYQDEFDDGAVVVAAGGTIGTYLDLEGTARSEADLITKYRELSLQPEVEYAIDEIVNEAINSEETNVVDINVDEIEGISQSTKNKLINEFNYIKQLLDVNNIGYELFRRWYIDARLPFHVIIDENNPSAGIQDLRYIDPRKLRKIREVQKKKLGDSGATTTEVKNEYWVYNERGFAENRRSPLVEPSAPIQGQRIAVDSVIDVTSGLMNENNTLVLSYLHKALRPMNQLRTMEDATIIYQVARAPERRIFHIDVGNLPKAKAEMHVRDMMTKHKNRLVYDATTGAIRDDRKHMTMLEDFWFPRREGGRGTEVSTLPAGNSQGQQDLTQYFLEKMYKSLNVPVSRLENGTGFTLGRSSEISRDEVKFQKFIARLRRRFSILFYKCLEQQLILKNIITPDEWAQFRQGIRFDWAINNHFAEMKNLEVLQNRLQVMQMIDPYINRYYSNDWVRKNVLLQTEEDIEAIDKQQAEEQKDQVRQQQTSGILEPDQPGAGRPPPVESE